MPQIVPDHRDVNARLQQRDGATMAHHVRSNVARTQMWQRFGSPLHILVEQIGDAIASQPSTAGIEEYGFIAGIGVDNLA